MTTSPIKTTENYNIKMTKVIELKEISKKYQFLKTGVRNIKGNVEDFWALKDISLDVYGGEILGIIGRNGAGKTSLLNIIAGVLSATQGKANINGKVLGLFNLGVGFQDELTGRENIFLNGAIMGATRKELEEKLDSIIEFSELGNFLNMPLGTYSQGMRLRLGFSIIINLDFDILAIDEVLAVGDALFQNKCFQRLMDFKREGKTLVITNQSMDLIERLCDRVILLDHGRLLFQGSTSEGISRYRTLLNTEKFFVGPAQKHRKLVENTKKWADAQSNWGKKLGTKEIIIDKVELRNKFGWKCSKINSWQQLEIKVYFTIRNTAKEPHFGIAIFRNDGVYCYGPNTAFDGYSITELSPGKGYFILKYHKLFLAPGGYKLSIAIWDKFETLAFDYHEGYYNLTIKGKNDVGQLLNMPFKAYPRGHPKNLFTLNLGILKDKWEEKLEAEGVQLGEVKLLNQLNEEKDIFITNEPVKLIINFNKLNSDKDCYLWIGIYREDGIYCQGITQKLNKRVIFKIFFPKLPLLPGGYRISLGVWDSKVKKFKMYHHGLYPFGMVFEQEDHGTVYLEHSWFWRWK